MDSICDNLEVMQAAYASAIHRNEGYLKEVLRLRKMVFLGLDDIRSMARRNENLWKENEELRQKLSALSNSDPVRKE